MRRLVMAVFALVAVVFAVLCPVQVWAAQLAPGPHGEESTGHTCYVDEDEDGTYDKVISTTILDCQQLVGGNGAGIFYILGIVINILTFGVGSAATVGIVISGFQYMTARDNAAQVMKAKTRILQIIIGLVVYALFWVLVEFFIPGGILNNS